MEEEKIIGWIYEPKNKHKSLFKTMFSKAHRSNSCLWVNRFNVDEAIDTMSEQIFNIGRKYFESSSWRRTPPCTSKQSLSLSELVEKLQGLFSCQRCQHLRTTCVRTRLGLFSSDMLALSYAFCTFKLSLTSTANA